ncbi:tetraspanin family domain-containing protein [Ditylenchus destructor]|uniref:Tetraspanin n=1 Tax=Ditylenchus destructor TaxID=166010 RepID=A0AAD4MXB0_9BILA|nr:tetraspanin family domain-containing protein [Ditylenchus destructor]
MVEGGITLVKYLLFFANFVLWVLGLGLIIVGAVLQLKYSGILDILGDERLATPVILLAVGCLFTLLGFLGYCGAIRENYCLTSSFAVLLALILLTETAVAIAAYALHEPLHTFLVGQLTKGMERYGKSKGVALAWDQTQQQMQCCGVNNASDWQIAVPDSCCVHFHDGCARMVQPILHTTGCVQAVHNWIITNATIVGGISALLGAVQVIGICFACCLSKSILKDFHDFYY